jgi:hypothetical protein
MGVDARGVESTDTNRGLTLDFCNPCTNSSGVVMASANKFDMVSSVENGRNEACLDCRRRRASDYNRRLSEKTREGSVDMEGAIAANR